MDCYIANGNALDMAIECNAYGHAHGTLNAYYFGSCNVCYVWMYVTT